MASSEDWRPWPTAGVFRFIDRDGRVYSRSISFTVAPDRRFHELPRSRDACRHFDSQLQLRFQTQHPLLSKPIAQPDCDAHILQRFSDAYRGSRSGRGTETYKRNVGMPISIKIAQQRNERRHFRTRLIYSTTPLVFQKNKRLLKHA